CSSSSSTSTSGSGGSSSSASTSGATSTSSASSSGANCGTSSSSSSGTVARVPLSVMGTTDTRFVTADHMFASVEMQLAGEPLAESMGRDLTGYSRDFPVPNVYFTPGGSPNIDLVGFGTAVESYEYSKQPMNNLAFESGAGTSFLFAPLVNPNGAMGAAALTPLIQRLYHYAQGSNAAPQPPVAWPPVGGNGATFVFKVDGT